MAKVSDLMRRTNTLIDDEIETQNLIDWYNQCQGEALAHVLYIPVEATLALLPSGNYELPANFKDSLVLVNSQAQYDTLGRELRLYGDKPSALVVEYNKYPSILTSNGDFIPEIPEAFHDLYIFYAGMMAMLLDEEHERYMYFREQFLGAYNGLKQFTDTLKSSRLRSRTMNWVVIR